MARTRIIPGSKADRMLNEFETKGFVSYSSENSQFLSILRTNCGEYYRIFKATHRGKKRRDFDRFGPFEIFGKKLFYYYDIRRKDEFVNFLVKLFYEKNPEPDSSAKKVFTRMLNYHGLSWIQKIDERKAINELELKICKKEKVIKELELRIQKNEKAIKLQIQKKEKATKELELKENELESIKKNKERARDQNLP